MSNNTFFKNESRGDYTAYPATIIIIINCAVNTIFMLMAIIGDSLVIVAILKTPSLRSPSMTILCGLAVLYLLAALAVQLLYVAKLREDLYLLRMFHIFLSYAFSWVSLVKITVISLDWFATLHYHLRYAVIVTKRWVILLLVTIWLINFLPFGLNLLNRSLYVILSSVVVILSLSTSSMSNIRIFQIVQRHQIDAQQQAMQCAGPGFNMIRVNKSSTNHLRIFIFLILLFSYVYFNDSFWKVK